MAWLDLAILSILALSALVGFARGLVRELFSFVIWLAALLIAWTFYKELAGLLQHWLAPRIESPSIRLGVAFLVLVAGMLIVGGVFGYLLSILVRKSGLTATNRAMGLVFGVVRGAVLVAMAAFLVTLTPLPQDPWWQESFLIGRFQVLADRILEQVPAEAMDHLKHL